MPEDTRSAITEAISGMSESASLPADADTESLEEMSTDAPAEEAVAEEAAAEVPATEAAASAQDAKAEEDDDFDKVPEFEEMKDGRKRVNRIPHPRVVKMIERKVKATEAAIREALTKEHTEKSAADRKYIDEMEAIGKIMGEEPDKFFEILASVNPAYKAWAKGAAAAAATVDPNNDPRPEPDGVLADGKTPGYTEEGWKKYEEWNRRQAVKEARAEMDKEYGWVKKEREAKQAIEASLTSVRKQIADAKKQWPGFEENYKAIEDALGADPKLSLFDGYLKVRDAKHAEVLAAKDKEIAGLKTDRNKQREEILAELGQRPKSTAAVPATHVPAKADDELVEPGGSETRAEILKAIRGIRPAA